MTNNCLAVASGFRGRALRLGVSDMLQAARALDCPLINLQAVLAVETAGRGFDAAGRPTMLFEPHVFYRTVAGALREQAIAQGVAYPYWGEEPYPATSDANYARLLTACAIDERAALSSASWGLGQVMGGNFAPRYASPQDMVLAAMDSETHQMNMLVAYICRNALRPALADADWQHFTRGYNGEGQVARYSQRLATYVSAHRQLSAGVPFDQVARPAQAMLPHAAEAPASLVTADDLNGRQLDQIRGAVA